mgnify:CR=1 FL=1
MFVVIHDNVLLSFYMGLSAINQIMNIQITWYDTNRYKYAALVHVHIDILKWHSVCSYNINVPSDVKHVENCQ